MSRSKCPSARRRLCPWLYTINRGLWGTSPPHSVIPTPQSQSAMLAHNRAVVSSSKQQSLCEVKIHHKLDGLSLFLDQSTCHCSTLTNWQSLTRDRDSFVIAKTKVYLTVYATPVPSFIPHILVVLYLYSCCEKDIL